MIHQTKPSLRPEAPRRKSRFSIFLWSGFLSLALSVGIGCGSQESTNNPSGPNGVATGSITFGVKFDPASAPPLSNREPVLAAPKLSCKGLGITWMRIEVLDESNKLLKGKYVSCDEGKASMSGISVGRRHLVIKGLPDNPGISPDLYLGPELYTGQSVEVTVSAVEDANAGVVTVKPVPLSATEPVKVIIENPNPKVNEEITAKLLFIGANEQPLSKVLVSGTNATFTTDSSVVEMVGQKLIAKEVGLAKVKAIFGESISSKPQTIAVQPSQSAFAFALSVTPSAQQVSPGSELQYEVKAELTDGDPRAISLQNNCVSSGTLDCRFSQSSLTLQKGSVVSSVLTVKPLPDAPTGIGTVDITATPVEGTKRVVTANVIVDSGPLSIATSALPSACLNIPYQFKLFATGGVPPYKWQAQAVAPDFSLTADGTLTGTPSIQSQAFESTYRVFDMTGKFAEANLALFIESCVPLPPFTKKTSQALW